MDATSSFLNVQIINNDEDNKPRKGKKLLIPLAYASCEGGLVGYSARGTR